MGYEEIKLKQNIMKTIKSIRATKNVELGTIKRVGEKEADSEVKSGYWKYVPKNEYKVLTRKVKEVEQNSTNSESPIKSNKPKKNEKNSK